MSFYEIVVPIKTIDKIIYVHKQILEDFEFFNTLFKGNFKKEDIEIKYLSFENLVELLYSKKFYYKAIPTRSENIKIDIFMDILNLLEFLQPKDVTLMDDIIKYYKFNRTMDITTDDILNLQININDKRKVLKKYISDTLFHSIIFNFYKKPSDIFDNSTSFIHDTNNNKIICQEIERFFWDYGIRIKSYHITCIHKEIKHTYSTEFHYTFGPITIDEKLVPNTCYTEIKPNQSIYVMDPLINFMISNYLLKEQNSDHE